MFNKTSDLKKLTGLSEIFNNSDEVHCPVLSVFIKNQGCLTEYTGDILSLNEKNEILGKVNSSRLTQVDFCVEAMNKDQVIIMRNIYFTQQTSCSEYIQLNDDFTESYIRRGTDSINLMNINQNQNRPIGIKLLRLLNWKGNKSCADVAKIE